MKKYKEFLRLRRQKDSVKAALILFVAILIFIVNIICKIIDYYKEVNSPVEYILEAGDVSSMGNIITYLLKMDNIIAVSRQNEYRIHFDIQNEEEVDSLSVTELSEEYLYKCYGIICESSGKELFLNSAAYEQLEPDFKENKISLRYYTENEEEKTASFIKTEGMDETVPTAVSKGISKDFNDEYIRVMFSKNDITGMDIERMKAEGLTVINMETQLKSAFKQKLYLTEIKYSLVVVSLLILSLYLLLRYII